MSHQREISAMATAHSEIDRLRKENESLRIEAMRQWIDVAGSTWETAIYGDKDVHTTASEPTSGTMASGSDTRKSLKAKNMPNAQRDVIAAAFRQIKYELYCASMDLLGFSLQVKENRNCIVRTAYTVTQPECEIEFVYDKRAKKYIDVVWTDYLEAYASAYQFWIQERQCIPGFMASLLLDYFDRFGLAPPRPRAPTRRPVRSIHSGNK